MAASNAHRAPRGTGALRVAIVLLAASLTTTLWLTAARPAFACSCVAPQPMAAYATADNAIFAGTAGPSDARGVPVRVRTWFSGPGPAPIVYLAAASFGNSSSCSTEIPRAGTDWVWVTFIPEGGGDLATGLCTPHAQLGTPEGDALLDDATAAFGGEAPPGVAASDPSESPAGPVVAAADAMPIAIVTFGLGLLVLAVLLVVASARRRARD